MDKEKSPALLADTNEAARKVGAWLAVVTGIIVIGVAAFALYTVRQYLPLIGYSILISLGICLACAVIYGIMYVAKFVTATSWQDIGEFGSRERGMFGKPIVYAPMSANTPKLTQRKNKVVVTPVVPSIIELIDTGVIAIGQLMMHMGFEQGKGGLIPLIDKWPGTFAIAGMGRSGKTRRVITIIIQAILGNARVFVCDPHRTKPDGLAKMIAPLAPWLTIAKGHEECMMLTHQFIAEMKRRVATENAELIPWVIIYDEFSFIMTSDDISDEDKAVIIECVSDCSTQYAGYAGFAGIIGQKWTQEATGGTVIRRSMHKVFVHTLNAEYAKFFVKGKWVNLAEDLEPRQCLYREAGQVKKIITLDVPDNAVEWVANFLEEKMPPEAQGQIANHVLPAIPERINFKNETIRAETQDFREKEPETAIIEMPSVEINRFSSAADKAREISRLRKENFNQSQIIQHIWRAKPGQTQAYIDAKKEYQEILEMLLRGVK